MTIDTKLDVYDEVYFMHNSKVWCSEVEKVYTRTERNSLGGVSTKEHYDIKYNPAGNQYTTSGFTDTELFKTKAELLETL